MVMRPIPHDVLLTLSLQLACLLITARVLGEVCRRFRLPSVLGELTAGVVLGPSILGALAPALRLALFPPDQLLSDLLGVVTFLGVTLLLLSTGLETDLGLIRRMGYRAPLISLTGIVFTFGMGLMLGHQLPDALLVHPDHRLVFTLFVATAMSISAIPVIARVLMELKAIRRNVGQLTLACGMIDDTVGWLLLSVVAGLASAGSVNLWGPLKSLLLVTLVLGTALMVARPLIARLYRWVEDVTGPSGMLLSITVALMLLAGALTMSVGLEPVLGAFIFGVLLRDAPRYRPESTHSLEEFTRLVLSPIFFATAGLKMDLSLFADPTLVPYALLVLAVACVGKFAGVFLGARLAGLSTWDGLTMGSGLNARGAMEIIVATIGLSLGVLTIQMFSIIVFVAIATSVMAPPLLRFCLARAQLDPEEAIRLEQEDRDKRSFWANVRRVLLPTRGGGNVRFAAQLLKDALQGRRIEVSAVNLQETPGRLSFWRRALDDSRVGEEALQVVSQQLKPVEVRPKRIQTAGQDPAMVLAELAEEHDVVVIGASRSDEHRDARYTFSRMIDDLLQASGKPVLVVSLPGGDRLSLGGEYGARPITRILVPSSGTNAGRVARELGLRLARSLHTRCTLLFIEEAREIDDLALVQAEEPDEAHPLVGTEEHAMLKGEGGDVPIDLLTIKAPRVGETIVRVSEEGGYDLLILRAHLRPGTRRAYLGAQVDYVLAHAKCAVAVLVTR